MPCISRVHVASQHGSVQTYGKQYLFYNSLNSLNCCLRSHVQKIQHSPAPQQNHDDCQITTAQEMKKTPWCRRPQCTLARWCVLEEVLAEQISPCTAYPIWSGIFKSCSKAVPKLETQSSYVSFSWNVAKEMFKLCRQNFQKWQFKWDRVYQFNKKC